MKKSNFNRMLAGTLAATLAFGASMTVFAADESTGTATGGGTVEGIIDTDVFKVDVPTDGATASFNFILDPQGLIAKSGAEHYAGKTFEENATLFFNNTADTPAKDYSSTSDELIITNKSTMDVDVSISASLSGADGITLKTTDSYTDDTSASMYLAVKDATNTSAITETNGVLTSKINKAPEDAYKVSFDSSTNKYSYELDTTKSVTFAEYKFQLTGSCNKDGVWNGLDTKTPSVSVTWNVKPHRDVAAPSISQTNYTLTEGTPVTINVDLGVGDKAAEGVAKVECVNGGGVKFTLSSEYYSYSDKVLTLNANCVAAVLSWGQADNPVTITFDDDDATAVEVTLKNSNI